MSLTPQYIRQQVLSQSYEVSIHANSERVEDGLLWHELEEALLNCEIVESDKEEDVNRRYARCYFCKGEVKEVQTVHDLRWRGKLFVFEKVPTGVCQQCGEKFLKPEVLKAMDQVFSNDELPIRTLKAPVFKFHFPKQHSTGLRRVAK